ncbi:hypothetical protein [Variovorax paradoxus]|uniref:hypothetical protein n=1 Tax=Variovorax paradoxus TaxID=34073 RepID=UPI003ECE1D29
MNQAEFEQHVRTGERNKLVLELMHNWCAHARARNHGGTGLIAIHTGLPLGMYGMECDYAPAGGLAGWYLEQGALDFYDRNCVHCDQRQPVRLPNLIQLVGERDRELARQKKASDRAAAEAEAARAARKRCRDVLRVGQSVATCSFLDDLEALDQNPSEDARTRIIETMKLAPEVLTPPIQEYFFELVSSPSAGCQAEALQGLQHSSADAKRLTAAALQCLARQEAIRTAAGIVMTNPLLADEAAVEAAVPALILLAKPPRSRFGDDRRELVPGPLEVMYDAWPEAVVRGIQARLDSRQSYAVRSGTAGLKVLTRIRPALLGRFAKTLVAKLARAHLLIDDEESDRNLDDVCSDLQRAIAAAFLHDPVATDRHIEDYFAGASSEGEVRLARAFHEVFRLAARDETKLSEDVVGTALARIIRFASTSTNFQVLNEVVQMLRGEPDEVVTAVRKNLDAVLGAAAVLDDHLEAFDAEQKQRVGTNMLAALEAQNSRSTLYYLREAFAALAAKAARGDRDATKSFIDFLSMIDEARTGLSSALITESSRLISTPEGLNLVLPELYTALVGSSTLLRARAAETLGRAGSKRIADLPELVLEAFVLLLLDRYVIVHKAAATALESVPLPPHLEAFADSALLQLIDVYRSGGGDKDFLAHCIKLYCRRYATVEQLKRGLAVTFIRILERVPASSNIREINSVAKHLQEQPEFVDLVICAFDDEEVSEYGEEEIMTLVYRIPDAEVLNRAGDLADLAIRRRSRAMYVAAIVEVLTRAGAWQQAAAAMEASWSEVPDTVPMRRLKWGRRMHLIAVQFELAVAGGDVPKQVALKGEWEALKALFQEDETLYAERRNPLPSFLRPNRGG